MSEQFLAAIIQILVGLGSVLGAVAVYIRSTTLTAFLLAGAAWLKSTAHRGRYV